MLADAIAVRFFFIWLPSMIFDDVLSRECSGIRRPSRPPALRLRGSSKVLLPGAHKIIPCAATHEPNLKPLNGRSRPSARLRMEGQIRMVQSTAVFAFVTRPQHLISAGNNLPSQRG